MEFSHHTIAVVASIPEFIYPIDNITVAASRDAQFTCVVNNLEGHKVMFNVVVTMNDDITYYIR